MVVLSDCDCTVAMFDVMVFADEAVGEGEDPEAAAKSKDKKKNREAQIQAEITKKFGKASISIRVANFFAGRKSTTVI